MKKEVYTNQEQVLADKSFSSAAFPELVWFYIHFPRNLQGFTVVDIGAGASVAVVELQRRGANSIAVDYQYKNVRELKSSVEKWLAGKNPVAQPIIRRNKAVTERVLKKIESRPPPGVDASLWSIVGELTREEEEKTNTEYYRLSKESLANFFRSLAQKEAKLVAAMAGNLPFEDESVDFAFSLQCITTFLMKDRDVFMKAISEALRILKPGGQLQLQPWVGKAKFSPQEKQNAIYLLQTLKKQGVSYSIEPTGPLTSPVLRIIKP